MENEGSLISTFTYTHAIKIRITIKLKKDKTHHTSKAPFSPPLPSPWHPLSFMGTNPSSSPPSTSPIVGPTKNMCAGTPSSAGGGAQRCARICAPYSSRDPSACPHCCTQHARASMFMLEKAAEGCGWRRLASDPRCIHRLGTARSRAHDGEGACGVMGTGMASVGDDAEGEVGRGEELDALRWTSISQASAWDVRFNKRPMHSTTM